jgi:hypothetical protein
MSDFSFGSIVPLVPAINIDEVVQLYVQELGFTKLFQLKKLNTRFGKGRGRLQLMDYKKCQC